MAIKPLRLSRIWAPWIPVVVLLDMAMVYSSGTFSLWLRSVVFSQPDFSYAPDAWLNVMVAMSVGFPIIMQLLGFYRPVANPLAASRILRRLITWTVQVILFLLLLFVTKSSYDFSRLWIGLWFFIGVVFFAVEAWLFHWLQVWRAQRGFGIKNLLLAGSGPLAVRTADLIDNNPTCGFRIGGYLSESIQPSPLASHPALGEIEDIENVVASGRFDEVWITLPLSEQGRIQSILKAMRDHLIDVRLVPDIFAFDLVNREIEEVLGLPVIGLVTNPQRGIDRILKRAMDIFGASVGLLLVSPVLLISAVAVRWTSQGTVFFVQDRHGLDGRPFRIFKLRTMIPHVPKATGYQQAERDDVRVTPVGRILRRFSIDELPQLLNVLRGDMSLVGPRPHPIDMNVENWGEIDRYALRHRVKPGITGWAQVHGLRGETKDKELLRRRVELDLYYIDRWSLILDIQILLRTLVVAWSQPTAY